MAFTKIQLSQLLAVYGGLLTDKQRDAMKMYCDCDCSLAEIAEEVGISRQGVRDAIVKGENTLTKLESELALCRLHSVLAVAVAQNDKDEVFEVVEHFISKE